MPNRILINISPTTSLYLSTITFVSPFLVHWCLSGCVNGDAGGQNNRLLEVFAPHRRGGWRKTIKFQCRDNSTFVHGRWNLLCYAFSLDAFERASVRVVVIIVTALAVGQDFQLVSLKVLALLGFFILISFECKILASFIIILRSRQFIICWCLRLESFIF